MPATMKDVAERAGVSIATVSFVVNNTKRVTPETRRRIEAAMAELGFRRNVVARALASRRTRIIALIYPALEHRISGGIGDFITGAARAASESDYHLVVWPISNDATELATLVGQGLVDGVLLMEVQLEDARVDLLTRLQVPFALIGRTRDPTGLDYVDIDFDVSMQLAMDHLVGLGHRSIILLSGSQEDRSYRLFGPYERMEAAFRRIAREQGVRGQVMRSLPSAMAGREAAARICSDAPDTTAVLSVGELSGAGLVAGLQNLGRRIPADMSVVCVLTTKEMASVSNPPLTLVTGPGLELGALGVRSLLGRLEGQPVEPVLRAGVLAYGESTAPPREPTGSPPPGPGRGGAAAAPPRPASR